MYVVCVQLYIVVIVPLVDHAPCHVLCHVQAHQIALLASSLAQTFLHKQQMDTHLLHMPITPA